MKTQLIIFFVFAIICSLTFADQETTPKPGEKPDFNGQQVNVELILVKI